MKLSCELSLITVFKALGYKLEDRGFETRWGEILNLPNPSGRTRPLGSTQPLPEMSTGNIKRKKKCFWEVKCGLCVGLITLTPSMSRLSRQCGIPNISQLYMTPRPLTVIDFKAPGYKPEGRGFETLWGGILNLPNPSGPTRPWGLLSLYQEWVPETLVVKALGYKPEGCGFESRWGEILNLPNPSSRTRPWGLLSL
jgi:hypothetical protein